MVAPFPSLLFHQVAILPLLFAVAFPFAAFFFWDQGKQILVLIVQVIQRPAEGREFLPQGRRSFFMGQFHILDADGVKAFIQQRRDLCAPFPSKFRQSVLYGSVKFQNVQRIIYDLCPVWHESTPFLVPQSLLLSRLTGADITSGKCLHRISVNKVIARNGLRLPAAISKY